MSSIFEDEEDHPWTEVIVGNKNFWAYTTDEGRLGVIFDIREDVLEWLIENVSPRATMRQLGDWRCSIPVASLTTNVYFRDPNDALLFKLTWG